ncbi:MAG: DNA replication terminus site-binding protein, partial [Pseudomonadota bacterium]
MVTKVQIRSQFDLLNELTLSLIDELKEVGFAKAEYFQ